MTEKNRRIFKEFVRLKWKEIKWFLKWPTIIIISAFSLSYAAGLSVFKFYDRPINYLEDAIGIIILGFVSIFLSFLACMILFYMPYQWVKDNWKQAKRNVEK